MSDMQRWKVIDDDLMRLDEPPHGIVSDEVFLEVVLAADAEAAIAAAEAAGYHDCAIEHGIGIVERDFYEQGNRDMLTKVQELLTETRAAFKANDRVPNPYRDGAIDALLVVSEALDYDKRFTNGQVTQ